MNIINYKAPIAICITSIERLLGFSYVVKGVEVTKQKRPGFQDLSPQKPGLFFALS